MMKKTNCDVCEKTGVALNHSIKIDERIYCADCFESHFSDKEALKGRVILREADNTICSFCSKDYDTLELKKISAYPVCSECEIKIKNKTFPNWVKAFFAGIILIVVISFFWNWKFFQAYRDLISANVSFKKGDYGNAARLMARVSDRVPEVNDFKALSNYFKGIDLLVSDKNSEAFETLNLSKEQLPPEYNITPLLLQAKIGVAFDKKDYQGFLEASEENLNLDSTLARSMTSVASAYACIYAEKGADTAKYNALKFLKRAKAIDSTSKEMKDYYNMVEYRLDSRKIIRSDEFAKQFPNGWTKN